MQKQHDHREDGPILLKLEGFKHDDVGLNSGRVYAAMLDCLSTEAVCSLLDTEFGQPAVERRAVLRRLQRELQLPLQPCIERLANTVLDVLPSLPDRKQKQGFSFLYQLLHLLPTHYHRAALELALASSGRQQRNLAYKFLETHWDALFSRHLEHGIVSHSDPGAARVAVTLWPAELLHPFYVKLAKLTKKTRSYNELHIKLGRTHPEVLQALRDAEPVTYAVVLAHLGMRLDPVDACMLYEANPDSRTTYLWIWAYGRMGLWQVIQAIAMFERDTERHRKLDSEVAPA